jgi:Fe-S-cluster-containing hydrogenase component 2
MMIMVDVEKCVGCRICELACSLKKKKAFAPNNAHVKIVKDEANGINVPVVCQHCSDAPCALVCPLNLYSVDEKIGAVKSRQDACIGCKACLLACPYGANAMDTDNAGRTVAVKCDLCSGDPLCVQFCPTQAIKYIRVDDADMHRRKKMAGKIAQTVREAREGIGGEL